MPVFRVEKNENYTPISNIPVRDMTLSLRAKGLLTVVLSLPDEWEFSIKGLASICREGRDGISSALNELQRNGYLIREQSRQPNGTMGSVEYFFYESPELCQEKSLPAMLEPVAPGTAEAKPDPVAPEPGVPDPASPAQLNTKGLSTKESNTEGEGKTPPHRKRYGRYRNVQLSDVELNQLKEEFPRDWQSRIERLSEYMASSGKSYRNHLATIRSWARRDAAEQKPGTYGHENYRFEGDESL